MSNHQKRGPQPAKAGAREENILGGANYLILEQPSPVDRAKQIISINDAWQLLGLTGKPSKSCKSPWRNEKNPSFSVFAEGRKFYDFSTHERGDVVEFIEKALGLSKSEAAKKLIAMANTCNGGTSGFTLPRRPIAPRPTPASAKPASLDVRKPTAAELVVIGKQRNLPESYGGYPGLEIAVQRGLLWVGEVYDHADKRDVPAWIVTDDSRVNAQARRMDGKPWTTAQGEPIKSKTLPGFKATWPIGAANLGTAMNVILTEGPPDMLAAFTAVFMSSGQSLAAVNSIGFACVTGANQELHPDSLAHFKGRRVRIVPDNDEKGMGAKGAAKWTTQLTKAGAIVDWFELTGLTKADGSPAKDLNEVTFYTKDDGWSEPELPAWFSELADFSPVKSEVCA
jgi:hypothetical protein